MPGFHQSKWHKSINQKTTFSVPLDCVALRSCGKNPKSV